MKLVKNSNIPKISIITPVFNCEKYINETVLSVVNQDFSDWEMLVVDDCSTDNTLSILKGWCEQDQRIRLIQNETNQGPGPSRNRGVDKALGKYIAYLDSDDVWFPKKLSYQFEFMEKTKTLFSFTSYELINANGKPLGKTINAPNEVSYNYLLGNTIIGCLTVMINREKIDNLHMPSLPSRQPLVLWLRILKEHGPAKGIDRVFAQYRVRSNSISSNKIASAKQVWNVYRDYEKLSMIQTLYYFSLYAVKGFAKNIKARR
ncbi:glycosyltransferase [Desulfatiferula olefinivorans]